MYDDRTNWKSSESEHFIYKYFPDSEAENHIKDIITRREAAYENISKFIGITQDKKFTLYFTPSREICHSLEMMADASVPHKSFASLVYNNYPFCREKIGYGHEIVHLLAYCWDKEIFHLEFLEEGLAVYLDQSGSNKHYDYYNLLQFSYGNKNIDISLNINGIAKHTNYTKAGSFVKFLIQSYGLPKFKQLYISSKIERHGDIFKINGKKLPNNYLKVLLKKIYHKNDCILQKEWLGNLGICL